MRSSDLCSAIPLSVDIGHIYTPNVVRQIAAICVFASVLFSIKIAKFWIVLANLRCFVAILRTSTGLESVVVFSKIYKYQVCLFTRVGPQDEKSSNLQLNKSNKSPISVDQN